MVEERPHPRGGFQVLVGDDPEFAGELFDRVGERAGEGWVGVAEIGREQRDADAVAGGGKLVDEARRAVDEGAFGGVAGEPCGGGGAGRFRLPADRRAACGGLRLERGAYFRGLVTLAVGADQHLLFRLAALEAVEHGEAVGF
jgi:hypothetical protein